jgi:hypothetical protein
VPLASENSLITSPTPQPAPAPEPTVAALSAPIAQLEESPAAWQGSIRRMLWAPEDPIAIVGPSRIVPPASASV